ncbi:protein kinase [Candidatus Woesearchaeota archaeon]|nr:protein kinase [Candidatus Woesearchaeota archaeon]
MKKERWTDEEIGSFRNALKQWPLCGQLLPSTLHEIIRLTDRIGKPRLALRAVNKEQVALAYLGKGIAGSTYLIFDRVLERFSAVKILKKEMYNPKEARILATLRHENIVTVHRASVHDWTYRETPAFSIEMDYVDGCNLEKLAELYSVKNISRRVALSISSQMLEGVIYLHEKGVFHRDLNPRNVVVDVDGLPKIVDFGIADTLDTKAQDNRRYGGNNDFFSWALITYKIVTGEHLVAARSNFDNTEEYAETIARLKGELIDETGEVRTEYVDKMKDKVGDNLAGKLMVALRPREKIDDMMLYLLRMPDVWEQGVYEFKMNPFKRNR